MHRGQMPFKMVFSFERSFTKAAYEFGTAPTNAVYFSQMSYNVVFLQLFSTHSTFDHVRRGEAPIICNNTL